MNTTRQREHWDGDPIELGDAWTLRKGGKVARCVLVTLRLMTVLRGFVDALKARVVQASGRL